MKSHGALAVALALCWLRAGVGGVTPRFYPDDPIARQPESQDARTSSHGC